MEKILSKLNLLTLVKNDRLRLFFNFFFSYLSKYIRRGYCFARLGARLAGATVRRAPAFTSLMLVTSFTLNGLGTSYVSVSPLVSPLQSSVPAVHQNNLLEFPDMPIDQETIDKLAFSAPPESRASARKAIPLVAKALQKEDILDSNVLAYALATIEHETDGTFEPIEEREGRWNALRFGYEGGTDYFGRGFIQLTHLRNYQMFGERIGIGDRLVENPDLATSPEIAAKILAAYFKDNNVAFLASQGQFVAARTPINPDNNGWRVASLAYKYLPA